MQPSAPVTTALSPYQAASVCLARVVGSKPRTCITAASIATRATRFYSDAPNKFHHRAIPHTSRSIARSVRACAVVFGRPRYGLRGGKAILKVAVRRVRGEVASKP